MCKFIFKRYWDFILLDIFFIFYLYYLSGVGNKHLKDISEISLNVSLMKDTIYIYAVMLSILLSASILILTNLLKTNNHSQIGNHTIYCFFSSSRIYFFALIITLISLGMLLPRADNKTNVFYDVQFSIYIVISFFLIIWGTIRMLRGVFQLKKLSQESKSRNKSEEPKIKDPESILRKRANFFVPTSLIVTFFVFVIFYNVRGNDRITEEHNNILEACYSKAEEYLNKSLSQSDFKEKLKYIDYAIYEANQTSKLEPNLSSRMIANKFRYLGNIKEYKVKMFQNYFEYINKKIKNSLVYDQKVKILSNAESFISKGLIMEYNEYKIQKLLREIQNITCRTHYNYYYDLGKKEELNTNKTGAKSFYYEALRWLQKDNISDNYQKSEISELKHKIQILSN